MTGQAANKLTGLEIAVIGMSGRFPGARGIEEFWDNLKNGKETVTFFSDEELTEVGVDSQFVTDVNYVKAMPVLEDKDCFDAYFFGYSPAEAGVMAPHIRIFHECAWWALEDAGYDPLDYEGLIGCYVGATSSFEWQAFSFLTGKAQRLGNWEAVLLTEKDTLGPRLAYKLDLKGPCYTFYTACSTSLAAVHLGSRALLTGECHMALAGGIAVSASGRSGYLYQEGMIDSPDGHCRTFDARAKGSLLGEGIGVVVLKRYRDAAADGDHIYAVVKGSAVNNDGTGKVGFTAPGMQGQREVIKRALQAAKVSPGSISYVEAHGTATTLGDPVEMEALRQVFQPGTASCEKHSCAVGCVKTNLGHLDAAAGIAGFIKTVLALYYRLIPPSLHFENPNPKINFKDTPFYVNTSLSEWKTDSHPLRAGVSSFGIGGTNAHVVLEEAPGGGGSVGQYVSESVVRSSLVKGSEYRLILLSAKTRPALEKMTENLAGHFKKNPGVNLADAAFTLQRGRRVFRHRRMVTCSTAAEAVDALHSVTGKAITFSAEDESREPPVIFMFPGVGSEYTDMGRELYEKEPFFRQETDRCFEILTSIIGGDIKGNQPAACSLYLSLFIFEYALSQLLIHWGIKPHSMIGYSFGEYTAACVSGVFSLEHALKVVAAREKLIENVPAGAMLSVPLSREELTPLWEENRQLELSLAIDNGPSCIVAGPEETVDAFEKQMKERRILCMRVPVSRAIHSGMMAPILKEFEEVVGSVPLRKPQIPYVSNVTGNWIRADQAVDPGYWASHMRQTVWFAGGMKQLLSRVNKKKNAIFLEVGPGRDLRALVARYLEDNPDTSGHRVVSLVKPPQHEVSDIYFLLNKIGRLWLYGKKIRWDRFYAGENRQRMSLPTYPFDLQRYWIESEPLGKGLYISGQEDLNRKKNDISGWFYIPLWKQAAPVMPVPGSAEPEERLCWLVFADSLGIGAGTADFLKKHGQDVLLVNIGTGFDIGKGFTYTVNPGEKSDYEMLFNEIRRVKKIPRRIVHFWSLSQKPVGCDGGEDTLSKEEVAGIQNRGFYSLLYLVESLPGKGVTGAVHLTVVTNNTQSVCGEDYLLPVQSTILGAVKVIPQENPGVRCSNIDISLPLPGEGREQNPDERLPEVLLTEPPGNMIALRDNRRWIQTYEPFPLPKPGNEKARLREGGVYMVTGGLGNIGLILAGYLAKAVRAKLILTGRSAFPPKHEWDRWLTTHQPEDQVSRKIRKLKEIEEMGGEVMVICADVADEGRMQTAISQAEEGFGPLNGVIHSSGIVDERYIAAVGTLEKFQCEAHFQPKIWGLVTLDKVLMGKKLDFFVIMSSLSSVLGGLGFSAYAAANIFMDTFLRQHNRKKSVPWIGVNWDNWQLRNGGSDEFSMNAQEGAEAFKRVLSYMNEGLLVHSLRDLQTRINRWIKLIPLRQEEEPGKEFLTPHSRDELSTPYADPRTRVEKKILEIWQHTFGFDNLGIYDDFFELGGDSLKVMTVSAKIHKILNVEIPLPEFFNRPTVEKLAQYMDGAGKHTFAAVEPVEMKEYYPLSSAQKRLYILQQMEKDFIGYNETSAVVLEGSLDKGKLERTFAKLIRGHESLRTSFHMMEDEPVQRVHQEVKFEIEYFNLEVEVTEHIVRDYVRAFDLSYAPLLRVGIIETGKEKYILIYDMHHIITDGISMGVFSRDFMVLYGGNELSSPRIQYKDFSVWQNKLLNSHRIKNQEEYWMEEFSDEIPVLDLPVDYTRPLNRNFQGRSVSFKVGKEETFALKELALKKNATIYMVLLAAYNVFLSKICNQEDIVVGNPTAGRRHADLEQIIGMFVNTLALRNYPLGERTFLNFLSEIRKRTLDAFENQEYPFEDLVEKVSGKINRNMSRNPLFDVMFVFQNLEAAVGSDSFTGESGVKLIPYEYEINTTKFDLMLYVKEAGDELHFNMAYCIKLFREETILRLIRYFKKVVCAAAGEPEARIIDIEIITEEEKNRLLKDLNETGAGYPKEKTIHGLFEEQAERTPDSIALAGKGLVTYRELNKKSGRLAHLLLTRGVTPETIVGLLLERSIEMIVGILGILKAGGVYLPIDPEYPRERIHFMLADSGANVLLKKSDERNKIHVPIILDFENLNFDIVSNFRTSKSRASNLISSGLAYIIYTSGTTGQPKGTLIEHRHVVRLMFNDKFLFDFNEHDVWTIFHSFCFDFSVWEMYGALLYGGELVIIPGMVARDFPQYLEILKKRRVTVLNQTPSAFYHLMSLELESPGKELNLRYVIYGGEALDPLQLKGWKAKYPGTKLINMYGITETTVHVTFKEIGDREIEAGVGNIGKPIPTLSGYILDRYLKLRPPGGAGELCVGGEGVGRGYLNRPELTREKFLESPYKPGERIYRSGDLARLSAAGDLEYLGRIDDQVKIRGFRIELEEIENRLSAHDEIEAAKVTAIEDNGGERNLCAYFVSHRIIPVLELRDYLLRDLPEYMIPSYFVHLGKMPLTANGKVDRGALPEPVIKAGESYTAPGNSVEEKLAEIWSEVLGVDKALIGIDDNFFQLGGHSLRATVVVSKIHKEFNVKIPLAEVFKTPSIKELALYIGKAEKHGFASISPVEKKEYYPLSAAQGRLYMLQQLETGSILYNMPNIVVLEGEIDRTSLEEVFRALISRHESFRTSFIIVEGEVVQKIDDQVDFKFQGQADAAGMNHFIRPFDLSQAPLLRVELVKNADNEHILMLDTHHIISDGTSQSLFVKGIMAFYRGEELPGLRIQYKDYSEWQNSEKVKDRLTSQEEYWLQELQGEIPVLNLPLDFARPEIQSFEGRILSFGIDKEESKILKKIAFEEGASLFGLLLAILNVFFSKITGQDDIFIGTEIAGRRHTDTQNIIGVFLNTLVLRNYPRRNKTFREFLKETMERTLKAFDNQDYPFENLVEKILGKREISRNPLFDVMFVWQNMEMGKVEIPGLTLKPYRQDTDKSRALIDLSLYGQEAGEGLLFYFEYNTSLLRKDTVQRFVIYFKEIVSFITANIDKQIRLEEIKISLDPGIAEAKVVRESDDQFGF